MRGIDDLRGTQDYMRCWCREAKLAVGTAATESRRAETVAADITGLRFEFEFSAWLLEIWNGRSFGQVDRGLSPRKRGWIHQARRSVRETGSRLRRARLEMARKFIVIAVERDSGSVPTVLLPHRASRQRL